MILRYRHSIWLNCWDPTSTFSKAWLYSGHGWNPLYYTCVCFFVVDDGRQEATTTTTTTWKPRVLCKFRRFKVWEVLDLPMPSSPFSAPEDEIWRYVGPGCSLFLNQDWMLYNWAASPAPSKTSIILLGDFVGFPSDIFQRLCEEVWWSHFVRSQSWQGCRGQDPGASVCVLQREKAGDLKGWKGLSSVWPYGHEQIKHHVVTCHHFALALVEWMPFWPLSHWWVCNCIICLNLSL